MKGYHLRKKIFLMLVICFLLASGMSATGFKTQTRTFDDNKMNVSNIITLDYDFSTPEIIENGEFQNVHLLEADINSICDGAPVLPVNLTIMMFPFGTKINNVDFEISSTETMSLSKKINYGRFDKKTVEDEETYGTDSYYPNDWVSYHTGGGLSDGEHTTFLVIRVYPVRYNPVANQISYINHVTITITYQEPSSPLINDHSEYDLLIVSPSQFTSTLDQLVNHKNNNGIKTKIATVEQIQNMKTLQGRDISEKIKYYIKQGIENWGVKYVLLVGGRNGQFLSWNTPVRYSHVVPPEEQEHPEPRFLSDLYFADIYDSEGEFSSWDTNQNGVFAEWDENTYEEMDLYPDVYVGRLACRNVLEVMTMVNKILNYEKNTNNNDGWFKKFLLVAGDSYNDATGFNEGELASDAALDVMPGFNPVTVFSSDDDINIDTVKTGMDPGCGFAYFCGHGSPMSWSTHFPYPPAEKSWTTGIDIFDMMQLNNKDKLPVVVVGGCSNARFDTSILNLLLDYEQAKADRNWGPRCWGWWMTVKYDGGGIACIANSGLGTHGREDTDKNDIADYVEILDGFLELRFFQYYGEKNNKILGENHGMAITDYLHLFNGAGEKMDTKMVQQWQLFGDPSLHIGGI